MITVLIADDQALVRAGFRSLLETSGDISVIAEATNGREAIDKAADEHPDVILMDIRMPMIDGITATRAIGQATGPAGPRVIILTTYESEENVFEAIRAGASGFLVKDTEPEDLFRAIRVVAAGDALLSPRITRRLIEDLATRPENRAPEPDALALLTERERQAVILVATGRNNNEIAATMVISPHTAKTHINRAMTKLNIRDRAQLVVLAYQCGLVIPTGP